MFRVKIKFALIVAVTVAAILSFAFSHKPTSTAKNDPILIEIAGYRSWTKINKDPIVVEPWRSMAVSRSASAFTVDGAGG
jgi:hypothetical protein